MEEKQVEPTEEVEIKIKTKADFYFNTPLYEIEQYDSYEERLFTGDVDGFNHYKKFDTTFSISSQLVDQYSLNRYRVVTLECKRNNGDKLVYFILDIKFKEVRYVMKVGQHPSLADISYGQIDEKYESVISEERLSLFKKAIGLASHGVGAGSFVYLRKIFEELISETYTSNKDKLGMDEKVFKDKRMAEKVEALKDYLPEQLVKMKSIYGILSNGVHKLSENECLSYFPALKLSIELIWDDQIELSKKQEKTSSVQKEIDRINQELSKK